MAKSPSPAPTLPCKQCNYINEPERVYCHNCGTKLDRSLLPKETEARRESPEKAQRRIKKMTNPGGGPVKRELKTFAKTIAFAVLAAGIAQMLREPADAPPQRNELTMRLVSSELMELANTPQPRAIAFTDADLNAALKQAVKPGPGSILKFDRTYVTLTPAKANFGLQQSVYGFPLHVGVGFRPDFNNGVLSPTLVSGNIGRLPVHPSLMSYVSKAFPTLEKVATNLKREREYLQLMRDIRIEQGRVILISKGAVPAPPAPAAPKQ